MNMFFCLAFKFKYQGTHALPHLDHSQIWVHGNWQQSGRRWPQSRPEKASHAYGHVTPKAKKAGVAAESPPKSPGMWQLLACLVLGSRPPLTGVSRALRARNPQKVSKSVSQGLPGQGPKKCPKSLERVSGVSKQSLVRLRRLEK